MPGVWHNLCGALLHQRGPYLEQEVVFRSCKRCSKTSHKKAEPKVIPPPNSVHKTNVILALLFCGCFLRRCIRSLQNAGDELPSYYASAECQINIILFTFGVFSHSMLTGVHILLLSSIFALLINAIYLVPPFILFLKCVCPDWVIYFVCYRRYLSQASCTQKNVQQPFLVCLRAASASLVVVQ